MQLHDIKPAFALPYRVERGEPCNAPSGCPRTDTDYHHDHYGVDGIRVYGCINYDAHGFWEDGVLFYDRMNPDGSIDTTERCPSCREALGLP